MHRTPFALAIVSAVVAACAAPASSHSQAPRAFAGIDTTMVREITRVLAHDSLGGRGAGSAGSAAAARIIERACRDAGLDPIAGRYRVDVPLTRSELLPETRLVIRDGPSPMTFWFPEGLVLQPSVAGTIRDFSGPAVYVGTEMSLREAEALPPLEGVVAVTLGVSSPDMSERLAAAGAVGLLHLVPDTSQFGQLRRNSRRGLWALTDSTIQTSHLYPLPSVALGREASAVLADAAEPTGATWPRFGRTVDVHVAARRSRVTESNVLCALPGTSDRAEDTALVYTAHYDHLGVVPTSLTGDSIYNGFSDNAAGVGMLLSIATALREAPRRPRHTVLFAFFAAEEVGLLGSEQFVHDPPWPLTRIRAVINLDAGAPPAKPWSWRIAGGDSSALGDLAMDVALRNGWSAVTSAAVPNSDYYPFWRNDVPAIFVIPGSGKYEGISADSSEALRERWDRYHQLDDEWNEAFPFEGLGRYAEYALKIGIAAMQRLGSSR